MFICIVYFLSKNLSVIFGFQKSKIEKKLEKEKHIEHKQIGWVCAAGQIYIQHFEDDV